MSQLASAPSTDNVINAATMYFRGDRAFAAANGRFYRTFNEGESITFHYLSGNVFHDANTTCLLEASDLPLNDWIVQASGSQGTFWTTTDSSGSYLMQLDTGQYAIEIIRPNDNWQSCPFNGNLDLTVPLGSTVLDLPMQEVVDCPQLRIDIAADELLRCTDNRYDIRFINLGTATAFGASATLQFDSVFQITNSSLPWTSPRSSYL